MSLFSTNWRTQITNILPPLMRSVSVIDFLTSLMAGLTYVMAALSPFNDDVRIRSLFNSQKMVLQAALNYLFATTGIVVQPGTSIVQKVFLYDEIEAIPLYSYDESESPFPLFIWDESELPDAYDFLILVPIGFYTAGIDAQIRGYMKIYKLAGKTFNVITY